MLDEDISLAYQQARETLGKVAFVRKDKYDTGIKKATFDTDEMVWYLCPRRYVGRLPTWQNNYIGPYRIVTVIDTHNVMLKLTPRSKPTARKETWRRRLRRKTAENIIVSCVKNNLTVGENWRIIISLKPYSCDMRD